jgi:ferritin-like metal-binding protein YciE
MQLGMNDAAKLLDETLAEEKTDELLSKLAETRSSSQQDPRRRPNH